MRKSRRLSRRAARWAKKTYVPSFKVAVIPKPYPKIIRAKLERIRRSRVDRKKPTPVIRPVRATGRGVRGGGQPPRVRDRYDVIEREPRRVTESARTNAKTCKPRPVHNKSKGGNSKAFVPWCKRSK